MVMLLFAAMVAMLLASFVVSMKTVALAMLGASFIALLIHRRGRSKAGELNSPKPLILAGGVLIVGMATLVVEMYLVIDAELAPTREAVSKTKEIEKVLAQQHQDDRFAAAKRIVDSAKSASVHKRLSETLLDTFRGADHRGEHVSAIDLQAIRALLNASSPSPAGTRSCSVYFAHVYVRQTGPADVHQVLSEYPSEVADCGGKVEYLVLVRRPCAKSGEWYAQCPALLPWAQLLTLRNAPGIEPGTQRALDTLLGEGVGEAN